MARLEITDGEETEFKLTLSRRNLLVLLHKLDMPGSARTFTNRYVYIDGMLVEPGRAVVVVSCEDDDVHYLGREPAGDMHPDTEQFVKEVGPMKPTL